MVQIEKGIPIPEPNRNGRKYPWTSMEVGDSFAVDITSHASTLAGQRNKVELIKNTGRKFSSAKQQDGGYRIWRIA